MRIEAPKGSPQNPLTKEALSLKFNFCLDNSVKEYQKEERNRILHGLNNFPEVSDVAEWIRTL